MVTSENRIKSCKPTLWSSFIFPWASCCVSVPAYYWLSSIRRLQSVIYPLSATDWPFMAHSYGNSSQTASSSHNNRCTDCVQWSSANPLWIQSTSVCGWWKAPTTVLKSPARYISSDITSWGYRGNPYDDSHWFKISSDRWESGVLWSENGNRSKSFNIASFGEDCEDNLTPLTGHCCHLVADSEKNKTYRNLSGSVLGHCQGHKGGFVGSNSTNDCHTSIHCEFKCNEVYN